jgi:hypothetical protein
MISPRDDRNGHRGDVQAVIAGSQVTVAPHRSPLCTACRKSSSSLLAHCLLQLAPACSSLLQVELDTINFMQFDEAIAAALVRRAAFG